jgi:hypothetical protein
MKIINIIDCFNNEHNLNVDFIFNVSEILPEFGREDIITCIHLHHKNEKQPFKIFKTFEPKESIFKRLESS